MVKKAASTKEVATKSWFIRIPDEKMVELRTFMKDKGVEPAFMRQALEESLSRINVQSAYDNKAYDGIRVSAEEAVRGITNVMEGVAAHLVEGCTCGDDEGDESYDADKEVADLHQANEELSELAVEKEQEESLDPASEIQ